MAEPLRQRARTGALWGALETARLFDRLSGWLVDRVRDVAKVDEAYKLTARRYLRMNVYPAKWHREAGLFDFEKNALERFFPAPPAHLLVHGAGGGREVHALLGLGFRVTAAEPIPDFAASARAAFGAGTTVIEAGLESEPPAELRGPFDGVIVGWGAYGHLLNVEARVRALRMLRGACPTGPILVSWGGGPRPGLRGASQTVGALAHGAKAHTRMVSHFGLFHTALDEPNLRDEASAAEYDLAWVGSYGNAGFPHAVLRPRG